MAEKINSDEKGDLMSEIEHLKKCMQELVNENEQLRQTIQQIQPRDLGIVWKVCLF